MSQLKPNMRNPIAQQTSMQIPFFSSHVEHLYPHKIKKLVGHQMGGVMAQWHLFQHTSDLHKHVPHFPFYYQYEFEKEVLITQF